LEWDTDKRTAKLLFLIGDAGPHGYSTDLDWRQDCHDAIARGIQINTIGCSGLESYPPRLGVDFFKQIAQLTDGKYDTLAYRREVVDARGHHETIVTAGGATFKVRAAQAMNWKNAVVAGAMDKVVPSEANTAAAMPGLSAMSLASPMSGLAIRRDSMQAAAKSDELSRCAISGGNMSRSDNNLDDIMLRAAEAKAKKTLHVGY
jgi:hypothetical protein